MQYKKFVKKVGVAISFENEDVIGVFNTIRKQTRRIL